MTLIRFFTSVLLKGGGGEVRQDCPCCQIYKGILRHSAHHTRGNTEPERVSRPAIYVLEGKLIEPTAALIVLLKPQELKNLLV